MEDPEIGASERPIEVRPVVVLSKIFTARPSSIPEIREFVRTSLADSPLTDTDIREVGRAVYGALLAAAGPAGTLQVSFRVFPDYAEVDVLHSRSGDPAESGLTAPGDPLAARPAAPEGPAGRSDAEAPAAGPATFAAWMALVLRREGLTHEAAARQLGVSVRTVRRWVGGQTEPRLRDLRRIQERFGDLPLR